jgi:uncharacterized protein YbjT (DUF2867 family)
VIVVQAGPLAEPAARLLAAAAARGHELVARPEDVTSPASPASAPLTLAISDGPFLFNLAGAVRPLAERTALDERALRLLVLSRLGAHPDAREPALQRLWRLEEHARACGLRTLTLRFAPLVGPVSPLWRKLRSRPALPRGGRKLLNPVAESDAVETIVRALDGRAAWGSWYEVAGPEAVTLAELRDLAAGTFGPLDGAWEPPLAEIAEHRLAESEPWASHFGITPTPLAAIVAGAPGATTAALPGGRAT